MKTFKSFVLIIPILFLECCSNKDIDLLPSFNLQDLSNIKTISLSDIGLNNIFYIPLETDSSAFIRYISRLRYDDNSFVVCVDKRRILRFAWDGSFISSIGKRGKGPNEYLNVHDLDIHENGNIYVLSAWENKFYIYSQSGEFVKSFSSPKDATKFKLTGEFILCYSKNSEGIVDNSFNLIDHEGNIVKKYPNKYPYKSQSNPIIFLNENIFYRFNGNLLKKEINSDTVFAFEDNDFNPIYTFNHGKKLMPQKAREDYSLENIMEKFITQWNLFEFGNKIYYEFSTNGERFSFVGSLKDDFQILSKKEQGFINDFDGGPNIKFKKSINDNTIISWINAFDLKTYVASDDFKNSTPKYPEKKKELKKLANSLDENDNPVLMLVKLKE